MTPASTRTEIPFLVLAGLSLAAVVALTGAHIVVPVELWAAFATFTGGGLGLTSPATAGTVAAVSALERPPVAAQSVPSVPRTPQMATSAPTAVPATSVTSSAAVAGASVPVAS